MRKATMRVSQLLKQRHGKPLGVRFFSNAEPKELTDYLDSLTNYEKRGVPKGAGTDSDDGFDLGRMRRLMARLGNPQSNFKAVHIAGTKGKGSTAAFLSNILRADDLSVGCYTSPHIRTIRERITIGKSGDPVSANQLNSIFRKIKPMLDEAILLENGHLTHFEVFTAIAFTLIAEENVDVAVIEAGLGGARDATNILCSSELAASVITTIGEEHLAALGGSLETVAMAKSGIIKHGRPVVLGGPFLPHIDSILRGKASLMLSPVVSASDPESRASIRGISVIDGRPCQLSDIMIKVEKDIPMFIEISEVNMRMLGNHQLQNALTAVCTALCLRDQGWRISDGSIRAGLENTHLPGRNQILSSEEAEMLGVPGPTILLDGAHTKDSAKALVDTIRMLFPTAHLALVVAMASDKDHLSFAREFLSGLQLEAVVSTEVDIAGAKSRTTSSSMLRDRWIQASKELCIKAIHNEVSEYQDLSKGQLASPGKGSNETVILAAEKSLEVSMKAANEILKRRAGNQSSVLVITGSLHIVSSALAALHRLLPNAVQAIM